MGEAEGARAILVGVEELGGVPGEVSGVEGDVLDVGREHGVEQLVLGTEIPVDHGLVRVRVLSDPVNAGTSDTQGAELPSGRFQDARAGGIRVSQPSPAGRLRQVRHFGSHSRKPVAPVAASFPVNTALVDTVVARIRRSSMSLESRLGVASRQPDRTIVEHAPQVLRRFLREHLAGSLGPKGALTVVGAELDEDTSDYNSPSWVANRLDELMADLDWLSVYRLLEEHRPSRRSLAAYDTEVNVVLARAGVAYEMVEGEFHRLDETGAAFGVAGGERDALEVLVGRFKPAREHYLLAVRALDAIPARPKDAIRESVNALEGVLKIITGRKSVSLGDAASELVRDTTDWRNALGASLKSLYGYVSSVPGARHSSYTDAEVSNDEAALVVRMCGAAIVYFIDEHTIDR